MPQGNRKATANADPGKKYRPMVAVFSSMSKKSEIRIVGGGALDAPAVTCFVFIHFRRIRNSSKRAVEGAGPYKRVL